jgi:hypothetical protein
VRRGKLWGKLWAKDMEQSEVLLGTPLENIMGNIIKNVWDLLKEKKVSILTLISWVTRSHLG